MLAESYIRFSNSNSKPFSPEENEVAYEECIANISPVQRQKRLRFGITQFIITLIILAVLIITDVDKLWRLSLLFMFWGAATGYFQWRDKT